MSEVEVTLLALLLSTEVLDAVEVEVTIGVVVVDCLGSVRFPANS